jgi:hypothetical protein
VDYSSIYNVANHDDLWEVDGFYFMLFNDFRHITLTFPPANGCGKHLTT